MSLFRLKKIIEGKLLDEAKTPGVDQTKKVQDASSKENKKYYKEVTKKMKDYDKDVKKGDDVDKIYNYENASETDYHDEMEIRNGQEMIQYDRTPNDRFTERAIAAIEGDPKMGNGPGANAEATWGASSDDFGKNLVKTIKAAHKKRQEAGVPNTSFGDDIELLPNDKTIKHKNVAVESKKGNKVLEEEKINELSPELLNRSAMKADDRGQRSRGAKFRTENNRRAQTELAKLFEVDGIVAQVSTFRPDERLVIELSWADTQGETYHIGTIEVSDNELKPMKKSLELSRKVTNGLTGFIKKYFPHSPVKSIDDLNHSNIKTKGIHENTKKRNTMKRLKFKVPFEGSKDAVQRIPESYKVDNKVFEITDGEETYRVKWEGTINEGEATLLMATDKSLIEEDVQKMKHLMGYKSEDTLGKVTGKARLDENDTFISMLDATKKVLVEEDKRGDRKILLETTDIAPQNPKTKLPNDPTLKEEEVNEDEVNEVEANEDHNPPIADAGIVESEDIDGKTPEDGIVKPNEQMPVTPHAKAEADPVMNEEEVAETVEEGCDVEESIEETDRLDEVFAGFDDDEEVDESVEESTVEETEAITESVEDISKKRFDDILNRMNQIT
jgi:hypothetical protein